MRSAIDSSGHRQTPRQARRTGARGSVHTAQPPKASSAYIGVRAAEQQPRLILNLRQAADLFGVSERKFHEWRAAGIVPEPMVLGPRALRWHRDELIEHVLRTAPRGNQAEPAALANARATKPAASAGA